MPTRPPLALQLLTLKQKYSLETNLEGTLDAVVADGYTAVEATPPDPAAFAAAARARGLAHAAIHVGGGKLRDVDPLLRSLEATGSRDVCVSGLLDWHQRSEADWRESIAVFNAAGRRLRSAGARLHYHNHDFEFAPVAGTGWTGLELLARELDAEAVDFCIDVAWVSRGGADPASVLRWLGARVGYLHFKDHTGDRWRPVGSGQLDWSSTLSAVNELPGVRWAAVEQDKVDGDPDEAARASREFLRTRGWP